LKHQVVRPFEHQGLARQRDVRRFDEREARGQRQRRGRRVVLPKLDQRAAVEIALGGNPLPPLPTSAGILVQGDQPIAFVGAGISKNVGIGRAGPLDDPDPSQKIDPAARSAIAPSGPISR
jgi:hypothetical protein